MAVATLLAEQDQPPAEHALLLRIHRELTGIRHLLHLCRQAISGGARPTNTTPTRKA